jgi:hypothetical protein
MTKIFLLLISTLLSVNCVFSQNASTYFPSSTGYKWYYTDTPLDTNNNPVTSLKTYRIDTFTVVDNYNGLQASVVWSKNNLLSINQNTSYTDTNYHNFQGTNGYEYFSVPMLSDTLGLPIGILNFFKGLTGWYNVYQFASTVNSQYSILTKDTTISINSTSVKIRVKVNATRLADESVSTVNGTYTAKKFVVNIGVYVVVFILEVPLVVRPDTTWLASGVWMVKDKAPSVSMDLSSYGYGTYQIPGQIYELTAPTRINNINTTIPDKFVLYQNYPNPFNPTTNIKFQIRDSRFVTLKVFDALGREVAILVNENLSAGSYNVDWNASAYPSGVYFYKLQTDNYSEVKKMILTK